MPLESTGVRVFPQQPNNLEGLEFDTESHIMRRWTLQPVFNPHLTTSNLASHVGPVSTDESPTCLRCVDPSDYAHLQPPSCENVVPGRLCDANASQEACTRVLHACAPGSHYAFRPP